MRTKRWLILLIMLHAGRLDAAAQSRRIIIDCDLAEAKRLDPHFTKNVKEVVLMGGAVNFPGNVSPVAEANISGDPDAADLVLTAPWKVTMIALNTTTKVKLDDDILLRIKNNNRRYGSFVFAITRFYADFHKNVNRVEGGFYVHDPSAVMYLIDPSIFTVRQGPARVVREGIAIGQTIMPAYDYQLEMAPWRGRPRVTTATDVDVTRFLETFELVMTRGSLALPAPARIVDPEQTIKDARPMLERNTRRSIGDRE